MKKSFLFAAALTIGLVSCEDIIPSINLPIGSEVKKEYTFPTDGDFSFTETNSFFSIDDLDQIKGIVESVSFDSIVVYVDSTNVINTDSLPSIDATISIAVDSVVVSDNINGSFQGLIAANGQKLNLTSDQLDAIADIVSTNSNNSVNTNYTYSISGSVSGAPLTAYFRLKLFGAVKATPLGE